MLVNVKFIYANLKYDINSNSVINTRQNYFAAVFFNLIICQIYVPTKVKDTLMRIIFLTVFSILIIEFSITVYDKIVPNYFCTVFESTCRYSVVTST